MLKHKLGTTKCALWVTMFVGLLLCGAGTPAYAFNYVGAWQFESGPEIDTAEGRGFNLFLVPANWLLARDGNYTVIDEMLSAIASDHFAIVALEPNNQQTTSEIIAHVQSRSDYFKVIAWFTFDEVNFGNTIPKQTQRDWYVGVKAMDASKSVILSFNAASDGAGGILNEGVIDCQPGLSWDAIMVAYYPFRWRAPLNDDQQDIADANAAAQRVVNFFSKPGCSSSSWVIPIQQAAYRPTNITGQLRPFYDLSQEYGAWYNHGVLNNSHALFYYGWISSPGRGQPK